MRKPRPAARQPERQRPGDRSGKVILERRPELQLCATPGRQRVGLSAPEPGGPFVRSGPRTPAGAAAVPKPRQAARESGFQCPGARSGRVTTAPRGLGESTARVSGTARCLSGRGAAGSRCHCTRNCKGESRNHQNKSTSWVRHACHAARISGDFPSRCEKTHAFSNFRPDLWRNNTEKPSDSAECTNLPWQAPALFVCCAKFGWRVLRTRRASASAHNQRGRRQHACPLEQPRHALQH